MRSFALDDLSQLRPLMADEILAVSGGDAEDGDQEQWEEAMEAAQKKEQEGWEKRQAGDEIGSQMAYGESRYWWAYYDYYLYGGTPPVLGDYL